MKFEQPKNLSEATVEAELFHKCKAAGLHPVVEYAFRDPDTNQTISRFDLIFYEGIEVVAIVEIKVGGKKTIDEEQLFRYKSYGPPVFILSSIYDIPLLVKKLVKVRETYLSTLTQEHRGMLEHSQRFDSEREGQLGLLFEWFDKLFPDAEYPLPFSLQYLVDAAKVLGVFDVVSEMTAAKQKKITTLEALEWLKLSVDHRLSKR